MRRYCDPKYKKKITASKDVLQLYSTESGRNLLEIEKQSKISRGVYHTCMGCRGTFSSS